MAPDSDLAAEAAAILSRQFSPDNQGAEPDSTGLSLEDLRRYVADQVGSTLARNPALMMSILYRVDVAEADAKRVLTHAEPDAIPLQLADLLIQRQIQKLEIRRGYEATRNTEHGE